MVKLLKSLASKSPDGQHSISQGVIRFKGRILISSETELQQHLITELHAGPLVGHSGFHATYRRLKKLFYWSHMKQMTNEFV